MRLNQCKSNSNYPCKLHFYPDTRFLSDKFLFICNLNYEKVKKGLKKFVQNLQIPSIVVHASLSLESQNWKCKFTVSLSYKLEKKSQLHTTQLTKDSTTFTESEKANNKKLVFGLYEDVKANELGGSKSKIGNLFLKLRFLFYIFILISKMIFSQVSWLMF